ncbi:hypothetical protein L2E82_30830 [Cichorium intybus]|uniref:Uncharacterized protein n=1 Tax=Cichorium intybus TaxID=13427 RepID=A0ACB9D1L6_CICIN|nr:hypothetical protein L2E82_30830 [Cichorium intybus]
MVATVKDVEVNHPTTDPHNSRFSHLPALDIGTLIVGAKYGGEFEERQKALLKEVEDVKGKSYYSLMKHLVLGAGRTKGSMDAANLFKPMLVVAAQLSSRYIIILFKARFQPDKVIDLVDEACANVRVHLDSQPGEIDNLERKRMQLEVKLGERERQRK